MRGVRGRRGGVGRQNEALPLKRQRTQSLLSKTREGPIRKKMPTTITAIAIKIVHFSMRPVRYG